MSDYQTFDIQADFNIRIVEDVVAFELSDLDKAEVERIWHEEMRLKGEKLFNGRMLCYLKHDCHTLYGHFVEYKHYIAVLRQPQLRTKIPIDTLGASGITFSGGSVLWGKRASFVTEYAGYYECAPSGGLNPGMVVAGEIPVDMPFEQELHEETGLAKNLIQDIRVTSLIYDKKSFLYEIVATIELDESASQKGLAPTDEYEELVWVDMSALSAFFEKHRGKILPMSYYLLTNVEPNR